nr:hypothetical protein [Tanacetum cinerariifolium]
MYYKKNVDYVKLLWEDFIYRINNKVYKKQEKMYYPRFTKVIVHYFLTKDKTASKRNKIGMHTSRDDYMINTLRFISDINLNLVPADEQPKSTKKKFLAMKTTRKQSLGVALRDTHVMSLSKKKEKVIVDECKGIELLSEMALTKESQVKEVHKKSMRDFHRTHPSSSGKATKITPSAAKINPSITNEGTGAKPGVPNVTKEESTESKAKSLGRGEDDSNNDHDSSSEGSDQENDSGDDNTQFNKEKWSDSKQETDENETGFESDQQENEEEVENDKEEKEDEFVNTPSNYTPTDGEDETNEESKVKDNNEELLKHAVLATKSSQSQSTYEIAASLTEFELKKILFDKMDKSQTYLVATPHRECYDGLLKSYDLDKSLLSTYDKVYSLKRSQKDKDEDEDLSAGSDRGLKKKKTSKDAEPTKGLKTKESKSSSSKGTKSQSKSFGKAVQVKEPEF